MRQGGIARIRASQETIRVLQRSAGCRCSRWLPLRAQQPGGATVRETGGDGGALLSGRCGLQRVQYQACSWLGAARAKRHRSTTPDGTRHGWLVFLDFQGCDFRVADKVSFVAPSLSSAAHSGSWAR